MTTWQTRIKSETADVIAPDGSEVRLLVTTPSASMAHFQLPPGAVSKAVAHRTVEELWYIEAGEGQMWRKMGDAEEIVELCAGVSLTIPVGTQFQFRSTGTTPLKAVGFTHPAWPGNDEAYFVAGKW